MVLTSLDTSELAVNRQTLRKGGVDFSMPGGGGGGGGVNKQEHMQLCGKHF